MSRNPPISRNLIRCQQPAGPVLDTCNSHVIYLGPCVTQLCARGRRYAHRIRGGIRIGIHGRDTREVEQSDLEKHWRAHSEMRRRGEDKTTEQRESLRGILRAEGGQKVGCEGCERGACADETRSGTCGPHRSVTGKPHTSTLFSLSTWDAAVKP